MLIHHKSEESKNCRNKLNMCKYFYVLFCIYGNFKLPQMQCVAVETNLLLIFLSSFSSSIVCSKYKNVHEKKTFPVFLNEWAIVGFLFFNFSQFKLMALNSWPKNPSW